MPEIKPYIYLNSRVLHIGRRYFNKVKTFGRDSAPFVIQVQQDQSVRTYEARAVIDATGTWNNPNPIGAGGYTAIGEEAAEAHIYYGIPDLLGEHHDRYIGKRVAVVGSGHSAINSLLDLAKLKEQDPSTEVIWIMRKNHIIDVYGGGEGISFQLVESLIPGCERLLRAAQLQCLPQCSLKPFRRTKTDLLSKASIKENRSA